MRISIPAGAATAAGAAASVFAGSSTFLVSVAAGLASSVGLSAFLGFFPPFKRLLNLAFSSDNALGAYGQEISA